MPGTELDVLPSSLSPVPCLHARSDLCSSYQCTLLDASTTALLTTSQEHYLKKYLLGVLINNELDRLQKNPYETLPNLGGPFDLKDEHANSTTPFLRYLFESIVVPFPFLTSSRGALWSKLQTFMDEWAKIEAGNGVEREEMIRRKRLKNKGERTLVLMYSMAIKTVEQRAQEKVLATRQNSIANDHINKSHHQVDSSNHSDLDLDHMRQLSVESNGRDNQHLRVQPDQTQASPARSRSVSPSMASSSIHGVRINVVGVRIIKVKRHVREHEHAVSIGQFFLQCLFGLNLKGNSPGVTVLFLVAHQCGYQVPVPKKR